MTKKLLRFEGCGAHGKNGADPIYKIDCLECQKLPPPATFPRTAAQREAIRLRKLDEQGRMA